MSGASKINFVDLLLYSEEQINNEVDLKTRHQSNLGYAPYLPSHIRCHIIQHANFESDVFGDNTRFQVLKSSNFKWRLPFRLGFILKKSKPDILLVHSMVFTFQIIFLSFFLGRKTKIFVQNHAESPGSGPRHLLEKLAANFINGFLFVSKDQALPWIKKGIIKSSHRIYEVMEGSTNFKKVDKNNSKLQLALKGEVFLWVGRLDQNKDPLTVLRAFSLYVKDHPSSKLLMIYGSAALDNEVKDYIEIEHLQGCVELLGQLPHGKLELYYNAADFFILGSHYEGSGYALCEAMACGCIPIVTDIPSFKKMTDEGKAGILFKVGDHTDLLLKLREIKTNQITQLSNAVVNKYNNDLSFESIASKLSDIIVRETVGQFDVR